MTVGGSWSGSARFLFSWIAAAPDQKGRTSDEDAALAPVLERDQRAELDRLGGLVDDDGLKVERKL